MWFDSSALGYRQAGQSVDVVNIVQALVNNVRACASARR
jgi:hypothetical protein